MPCVHTLTASRTSCGGSGTTLLDTSSSVSRADSAGPLPAPGSRLLNICSACPTSFCGRQGAQLGGVRHVHTASVETDLSPCWSNRNYTQQVQHLTSTACHLVGAPVGILKSHVLHGRQAHHPGAAAPPLAAHHAPLQSAVQLRTESKGDVSIG